MKQFPTSTIAASLVCSCFCEHVASYVSITHDGFSRLLLASAFHFIHTSPACASIVGRKNSGTTRSKEISELHMLLSLQRWTKDLSLQTSHPKKKKNVLKPVRKCLKELKREVLWTMLHLTYCSSMEPALKTVSRSFWHRLVNPSAQPNGHSKQQYLLLSLIHSVVALIWSSQRCTISGGGTVGVHERSLISRNKSCLSLISTKRRKLCNNAAESTVKSFHIEM